MKSINTSISTRLAALLAGAALFGLVSQSALAIAPPVGTSSGTQISNTASLDYKVGGFTQTTIASPQSQFLVDEKINLTVLGGSNTNVVPNATGQAVPFLVTNNSNSPLDFALTPTSALIGDDFNPSSCNAYVESEANAGYLAAEDTATFINELPSGSSATVYVVCTIPTPLANTKFAYVGLTATAKGDFTGPNGEYVASPSTVTPGAAITFTPLANADTPGSVDIVFADGAGPDDTTGARDGMHSAHDTYTVSITVPTVSKVATVLCDPFNGTTAPKNIPGAIVQYAITVSNPSAVPVILTSISDTLDIVSTDVAFDPGLRAPTASVATCIAGTSTSGIKIVSTTPNTRGVGGTLGVMTNSSGDSDGASFTSPAVAIDFANALPAGTYNSVVYAAGELKPSESATITFNVIVTP